MCIGNSYFPPSTYTIGPFISECQAAHLDSDCFCVDKHGTLCDDYTLNYGIIPVNCHGIISNYRYEVAGVVGALTIGTALLILYVFLVIYSLCYQAISKYPTPQCIKRCYACFFPPPPEAPEEPAEIPEEVERKRNHLVSRMLQEAADNAYNHEKIIEVAAESKTIPRKIVWEDEVEDAEWGVMLTPRREQRYVEQYVSQKYPHLVDSPSGKSSNAVSESKAEPSNISLYSANTSPAATASVVAPSTTSPAMPSTKSRKDSVQSGVSSSNKGFTAKPSQKSEKQIKSSSVVPINESPGTSPMITRATLPPIVNPKVVTTPTFIAAVTTASTPAVRNWEDTSSSEEDSATTPSAEKAVTTYSDDEYERPPRRGEGRFEYLDDYLDAKVAQRIAAYQQDLMQDPELEDHSFSLQPLPEVTAHPSHTLDDVKSHDLSTVHEESWLGFDRLGDSVPYARRDPTEGQILVPLQDTWAEDVVRDRPPYLMFTHLPPLSQQTLEMQQGGVPRDKKVFIQNQQYKQQMYLYQHV